MRTSMLDDLAEIVNAFGVADELMRRELISLSAQFSQVPFPQRKLEAAAQRGEYALVPILPVSMNWLLAYQPQLFRQEKDCLWWSRKSLAEVGPTAPSSWRLIRTVPEPDSLGLIWTEQEQLSRERGLWIPQPRVITYFMVVMWLVRGVRLFSENCVRCSGKDDLNRWTVGMFDDSGISIVHCPGNQQAEYIGLASAVRSF